MDPRRLSGWYLLLDSGHSPVGHQDELGGKRHIAAQGPVYLQQVPQLWLLREGQVMWNEKEWRRREKERQRTTSKSITKQYWAAMSHIAKTQPSLHCNTEHNPQEQETGNNFLTETSTLLSNVGLGQLLHIPQGWLKD